MGNRRGIRSETSTESAEYQEASFYLPGEAGFYERGSYGSIKRFETSGQISLISLTKIAMALDIADDIRNLFTTVPYRDIQEVINETK